MVMGQLPRASRRRASNPTRSLTSNLKVAPLGSLASLSSSSQKGFCGSTNPCGRGQAGLLHRHSKWPKPDIQREIRRRRAGAVPRRPGTRSDAFRNNLGIFSFKTCPQRKSAKRRRGVHSAFENRRDGSDNSRCGTVASFGARQCELRSLELF